jgi:hypothetical protein
MTPSSREWSEVFAAATERRLDDPQEIVDGIYALATVA